MKIIFNADDFGITDAVSGSIIELMKNGGLLKSTTVMINLLSESAAEKALAFLKSSNGKEYSFGLHFNLTCGRPVLPAPKVSSLVDGDGRFLRFERIVAKIAGNRAVLSEIEAEFFAQAQKFEKVFGFPPSHVDSHKHMHCLPGVMNCVLKSFGAFGITRLRLPAGFSGEELFTSQGIAPADISGYFARFGGELEKMPEKFGIPRLSVAFPGAFLGTYTVGRLSTETFEREARGVSPRNGVIEYMCHPGTADEKLAGLSGLLAPREAERDALASEGLAAAVEKAGLAPASFFCLGRA